MIRTPLRPLARILDARARGENPDAIERENIRLRGEVTRDRARLRAEGRLLLMAALFLGGFVTVGIRMGMLAAEPPQEPQLAASGEAILAQRADIVDRNGRVLATNLVTHALYAQPMMMVDPVRTADELVRIFPDLDRDRLVRDFTGGRKFLWIKKKISPEQMQAVHDIGDPGLLFGPREMRLYPNGAVAAHILGGASFGREGVDSAEVVGVAGTEKAFDGWLRDPANEGAPLRLSIDLTVQAAMEEVLRGGVRLMDAKGATGILMEVATGEIVAMASLPDFDPNDRPAPLTKGDASDSPLFNRAVQGVYELGSTFKIFAVAQALEMRLVNPDTMIETRTPMYFGKHRIKDFRNYGPQNSVTQVIAKSSNVGTARIATMIGGEAQRAFLGRMGFFEPTTVELAEAPTGRPLLPPRWGELVTLTVSYGHGMSASPLHLAAGYAMLANGGRRVTPTLIHGAAPTPGEQIVRPEVARQAVDMMRKVVTEGTASFGEVKGYQVAGKTGTAEKTKPGGGYWAERNINTFASVFPASDPKYVLVVSMDEAVDTSGSEPRRTAGWTAVPIAAEVVRRTAPLLGLRPLPEPAEADKITLVRN